MASTVGNLFRKLSPRRRDLDEAMKGDAFFRARTIMCSPDLGQSTFVVLEINENGLAFYNVEGPEGEAGKFADRLVLLENIKSFEAKGGDRIRMLARPNSTSNEYQEEMYECGKAAKAQAAFGSSVRSALAQRKAAAKSMASFSDEMYASDTTPPVQTRPISVSEPPKPVAPAVYTSPDPAPGSPEIPSGGSSLALRRVPGHVIQIHPRSSSDAKKPAPISPRGSKGGSSPGAPAPISPRSSQASSLRNSQASNSSQRGSQAATPAQP